MVSGDDEVERGNEPRAGMDALAVLVVTRGHRCPCLVEASSLAMGLEREVTEKSFRADG